MLFWMQNIIDNEATLCTHLTEHIIQQNSVCTVGVTYGDPD